MRMIIISMILAICFSNCNDSKNKKYSLPGEIIIDSCQTIISAFQYPLDLNRDSIPQICSDKINIGEYNSFRSLFSGNKNYKVKEINNKSIFSSRLIDSNRIGIEYSRVAFDISHNKRDSISFSLNSGFYDNNFFLLRYGADTKILYDRKADVILCFKRNMDYGDFSEKSIYKIYILDDQLMPIYSINKEENEGYVCRQYFYDAKYTELYSDLHNPKGGVKKFSYLKYDDILSIFKSLQSGKMPSTGKFEKHLSEYFKRAPLWTEN